MSEFVYRNGFSIPGVSANDAAQELDRIHQEGGVTPARIVEASRPEEAPLHPAFDWDDPVAAEKWREHQARWIPRSILLVKDDQSEPEPAWVHITLKREDEATQEIHTERSYKPMSEVCHDPDLAALARGELLRKLDQMQSALDAFERALAHQKLTPSRRKKVKSGRTKIAEGLQELNSAV